MPDPSLTWFCVCVSYSRFYSERGHNDDDDDEFYYRRPQQDSRFRYRNSPSGSRQPYSRRSFGSHFDDYGDDEEPRREWGSQPSRFSTKELGANIKKKAWDINQLPPLEKNFYVEHQSLTEKSEVFWVSIMQSRITVVDIFVYLL